LKEKGRPEGREARGEERETPFQGEVCLGPGIPVWERGKGDRKKGWRASKRGKRKDSPRRIRWTNGCTGGYLVPLDQ